MCETLEICWLQWQMVSNPGDATRLALIVAVLIIVAGGAIYGCCRKTT